MTLNVVQLCENRQKYPWNINIQKILFFLKTPENIEIQNAEPPKTTEPTYAW